MSKILHHKLIVLKIQLLDLISFATFPKDLIFTLDPFSDNMFEGVF